MHREEYSLKNNFYEDDNISIVSKKDILLEKVKKIEEEEKIRKLIEKVFCVKSYKLYILDKYGNGAYDIFIKKYKKGLINKSELESELNRLKELLLKNKKSFNKNDKGNKMNSNESISNNRMNPRINDINSINILNSYQSDDNLEKYSSKKYKKNKNENNQNMISNNIQHTNKIFINKSLRNTNSIKK